MNGFQGERDKRGAAREGGREGRGVLGAVLIFCHDLNSAIIGMHRSRQSGHCSTSDCV